MRLPRTLGVILSLLLMAGPSGALLFDGFFRSRPEVERMFCRFLICANDLLVQEGYRQRWADRPFAAAEASREALRRDPASVHRWLDLAEALLQTGDAERGRRAMERAVTQAPHSPGALLRATAFCTEVGDLSAALRQMARVLALTDAYDALIFSQFRRLGHPAERIHDSLEANRRAAEAYFRFLLATAPPDEVQTAWRFLRRQQQQPDDRLVASYVDYLLGRRHNDAAVGVWSEHFGPREPDYPNRNLVFNGDFEFEPTGALLDWRIAPSPHASARRDGHVVRSGSWSLRIDFDGRENLYYENITQFVVVRPGCLRFRAGLRTENITTDEGVRFRISDEHGRLDVVTEDARETSDWRRIEKLVRAPEGVRRVRVQVIRKPSQKFDNKLGGTAWIDRVELTPERCPGAVAARASGS